jgi:hypothetical protein
MMSIADNHDVEPNLSDFSDKEIIKEFVDRGLQSFTKSRIHEDILELYEAYTFSQAERVDRILRQIFYEEIGRIAP